MKAILHSKTILFVFFSFISNYALAQCPTSGNTVLVKSTGTNPATANTLAWCIDCLNSEPNITNIEFDIAGAGPHTIIPPTGGFAVIGQSQAKILGSTQPTGNIIIDGTGANAEYGFSIGQDLIGIDKIRIENFKKAGVFLGSDTEQSQLDQLYIKDCPTGISGFGTEKNNIVNCTLEDNTDGIVLENGPSGIGGNNIQDNIITGSDLGILFNNSSEETVKGCTITGTGAASLAGIQYLVSVSHGGIAENNDISNFSIGIELDPGSFDRVHMTKNSIFCNGEGIFNHIPTDAPDAPTISASDDTQIKGGSSEGAGAVVEVFYYSDSGCGVFSPSNCQGKTYLGNATTNASGDWQLLGAFSVGAAVTATITKSGFGTQLTSEFSGCSPIVPACPTSNPVLVDTHLDDPNLRSLRWAIGCVNDHAALTNIRFDLDVTTNLDITSALPNITSTDFSIDGINSAGSATGYVTLDGTNAGFGSDGLRHSGKHSEYRHLIVTNFDGSGIETVASNWVRFFRVDALDNGDNGIYVSGTTESSIVTVVNTDDNGKNGIHLDNCNKITANVLNADSNGETGILTDGCDDFVIQSGGASLNLENGIFSAFPGPSYAISSFMANDNNFTGIEVLDGLDVTLNNITTNSNTASGISVSLPPGFGGSETGTYTNITSKGNAETGFSVNSGYHDFSASITIENNDNGVSGFCDSLYIDGGTFSNNNLFGVNCSAQKIKLENMTIDGNIGKGVNLTVSTSGIVDNCDIENNILGQAVITGDEFQIINSTLRGTTNGVSALEINGNNYFVSNNTIGNAGSGNVGHGIDIHGFSTQGKVIGNTIGYNTVNGIHERITSNIFISQNDFLCNDTKGIAREPGAPNIPIITNATLTSVTGTAPANSDVEIFVHDSSCPTLPKQGAYIATTTANASGDWSRPMTLSLGDIITATATENDNNTSEFSLPWSVTGPSCPTGNPVTVTSDLDDVFSESLRWAIGCVNDNALLDEIVFDVDGTSTIVLDDCLPVINSDLIIDGINLGTGGGEMTIDGGSLTPDCDGFVHDGPFDATFRNITLTTFEWDGIWATSSGNVVFNNVTSIDNGLRGIAIEGPTGGTMTDCETNLNFEDGLGINNCNGYTITNHIANGNNERGMEIRTSSNVTVSQCSTSLNTFDGLFSLNSNFIDIDDHYADGNMTNGIRIEGSPDATVDNSEFTDNDGVGILHLYGNRITITNVNCDENNQGILLVGGDDHEVKDSEIGIGLGNSVSGITIQNPGPSKPGTSTGSGLTNKLGSGIVVENNEIANNAVGVRIDETNGTPFVEITNNQIYCNTSKGIEWIHFFGTAAPPPAPVIDIAYPGVVSGTAPAGAVVEVFLLDNSACTSNTVCQGKTLLGTVTATGGNWSIIPAITINFGDKITATSTNGTPTSTSEFADCETVQTYCPTSNPIIVKNNNDTGLESLRWAIGCANANPTIDNIIFNTGIVGDLLITSQSTMSITDDGVFINGSTHTTGDVIIEAAAGFPTPNLPLLRVNNADNVELKDFQIVDSPEKGLKVISVDGLTLEDMIIENNASTGVSIENCANVNVDNCDFIDNGAGGFSNFFTGGIESNITIDNSTFINNAGVGITLENVDGVTITNTVVDMHGSQGIIIRDSDNLIMDQVESKNTTAINGILIDNSSVPNTVGAQITNITVTNNGENGIKLISQTDPFLEFITATGNGHDGIEVSNTVFGTVKNSTIYDNSSDGIETSNVDTLLITRNIIYCNGSLGINKPSPGPPVITSASPTLVTGTTTPSSVVEVFFHSDFGCTGSSSQGKAWLATTTSDLLGDWTAAVSISDGTDVTATVTNPNSNTSGFATHVTATVVICPTSGPVTVKNTNDSGDESLRWAIGCANANPNVDVIEFDFPTTGTQTISPTTVDEVLGSKVYKITDDGIIIDGSTYPDGIVINGSSSTGNYAFSIEADNVKLNDFIIQDFPYAGVLASFGFGISGLELENMESNNNGDYGITANVGDPILTNVTANDNGHRTGADGGGILLSWITGVTGATLDGIYVDDNEGEGLRIGAIAGTINIDNVFANRNTREGVYFDNLDGTINANTITSNDNTLNGIHFFSCGGTNNLIGFTANDNGDNGLFAQWTGFTSTNNFNFDNNVNDGAEIFACSGTITIGTATNNQNHGINTRDCNGFTIDNYDIYGNTKDGLNGNVGFFHSTPYATILKNSDVYNNGEHQIIFGGQGSRLENTNVYNSSNSSFVGVSLNRADCVVDNCVIGDMLDPLAGAGIEITNNGAGAIIQNSTIHYNPSWGVIRSDKGLITQNMFSCNGSGISGSLNIPTISTATTATISGMSVANAVIEVFEHDVPCSGPSQQGYNYKGTTTADGSGNWALAVASGLGENVTATATLNGDDTSPFSNLAIVTGTCPTSNPVTINNNNDSGVGSLRWGIDCVVAEANLDQIHFNIGGGGNHTITPLTVLPKLDCINLTIDGSTQPSGGLITLDGTNFNSFALKSESFNGLTVKNLNIENFRTGIQNTAGDNATIENVAVLNSSEYGIQIELSDFVQLTNVSTTNTTDEGIIIFQSNTAVIDNATVTGAGFSGIYFGGSEDFVVKNSTIDGLGGSDNGIYINSADAGGEITLTNITGNLNGIRIAAPSTSFNTLITNNSIYCNTNNGILRDDGMPTEPTITSANTVLIEGTAQNNATIEIFIYNDSGCEGGPEQGKIFVASVTADGSGIWAYAPSGSVSVDDKITATSTIGGNNTSPFSSLATVLDPCINASTPDVVTVTNISDDTNPGSLRWAIGCTNNFPNVDTVKFNIPAIFFPEIAPASDLPEITGEGVVIDGSTQPTGRISIWGGYGLGTTGLNVSGNNFELKDLDLAEWSLYGLSIKGATEGAITSADVSNVGFFTNTVGMLADDFAYGVEVDNCTFDDNAGGVRSDLTTSASLAGMNVSNSDFSNNTSYCIRFLNNKDGIIDNCTFLNNPSANGIHLLNTSNNEVKNCLFENNSNGIICEDATGFDINNNEIGTATAGNINRGVRVIPNVVSKGTGVGKLISNTNSIASSAKSLLAGGGIISNNIIANNGEGIRVQDNSALVEIKENEIFCNSTIGIERTNDTPAIPLVAAASTAIISGTTSILDGYVEVFVDDKTGCASAPDQGRTFVGSTMAISGVWSMTPLGVNAGDDILATVTTNGNTSQFSLATVASPGCPTSGPVTVTDTGDGTVNQTLRWAIECVNADPALDLIEFNLPAPGTTDSLKIKPTSQLPFITDDAVFIDGSSQPTGDRVYIDGSSAGGAIYGLSLQADALHLFKLGLINWGQDGIQNFGDGSMIDDVEFLRNGSATGPLGSGIRNNSGSINTVVFNCYFEDNEYGVSAFSAANLIVQNSNFKDNIYSGVFLSETPGTLLDNLDIENSIDGIRLDFGANNTIIKDLSSYSNSGSGIYLEATNGNIVENVNVHSNGESGIRLISTDLNTITDSDIYNNSDNGIYITNSTSFTIEDNNIGVAGGNIENGIDVTDLAFKPGGGSTLPAAKGGLLSSGTIQNNTIQNNSGYGVLGSSSITTFPTLLIVNNNMQCNTLGGISRGMAPAMPDITLANPATISGTGVSGNTIHVYTHNPICTLAVCQGLTSVGTTTVSGGVWSIVGAPVGTQVTATQTAGGNNTSPFSACATSIFVCDADTSSTNVFCYNDLTGTATSTGNSSPPYTYLWSTGTSAGPQTGPSTITVGAGNYLVTVTDNDGCIDVDTFNITQPAAALNFYILTTHESCFGYENGELEIDGIFGGTPPYSVSWSTGATSLVISNLAPGNYQLTITDANLCSVTDNFDIDPGFVTIDSTRHTDVTCFGEDDGTATVHVNPLVTAPSIVWSDPGASTTPTITGLAPGKYYVTVTVPPGGTGSGCIQVDSVTISEPTMIVPNLTSFDETCYGLADGNASVSPTGGVPPYIVTWSTGATGTSVFNLAPNNYSVTVKDATDCEVTLFFVIGMGYKAIDNTTSTNVTCNGFNDGTGTVNLNPLTTSFSILWSTGATTATATGLAPGKHYVTVVDNGRDCIDTDSVEITQPPVLSSTLISNDETCYGLNDGNADIFGGGGTPGYTYAWSTGSTNDFVENLAPDDYDVTIIDANGCIEVLPFTIAPGYKTINNTTSTNVTCNGFNDGTGTVNLNPLTTSFSIIWSTGATTATATGLVPGKHYVTVVDNGRDCIDTDSVEITQPTVLVSNFSKIDITCFGVEDGSATAAPSGGTPPYTFAWSTGSMASSITGLAPDNYSLTLTDANSCEVIENFTILEGIKIIDATVGTLLLCFEDNTGTATVGLNPSLSATPPATYSWSTGGATETITGLAIGKYYVTVTKEIAPDVVCIDTDSVEIFQPPLLVASATKIDIDCFGANNGSATASATGGTMPYTYLWDNSATTATINNLTPGTYTVTVTDANDCSDITSIEIIEPLKYITGISGTDLFCNDDDSGTATVSVSGDPLLYIYSWSNGDDTQMITDLAANTYTVTVTDSDFICEETETITISEPPLLESNPIASDMVTCFGFSDGTLDAGVTGGTPPYTYLWIPGGYTTGSVTGVPPGSYAVDVTDDNDCIVTSGTVVIGEPAEFLVTLDSTDLLCFEDNSGEVDATPINGVVPITYAWSNGDTGISIDGLAIGTYTVTATDDDGCLATGSSSVNQPTQLTATTSSTLTTCYGDDDATAMVDGANGTPGYTYAWSNGDIGPLAEELSSGFYYVTVEDVNNCEIIEEVEVFDKDEIYITFDSTNVTCAGLNDGTATAMAIGGTGGPYDYIWEDGTFGAFIDNLGPGFHEVEAIDNNGCYGLWDVEITEPNPIVLTASATNVTGVGVNDGTATASGAGDNPPFTYLWTTGSTSPSISGLAPGGYTVSCTDANNCMVIETVFVGGINCNLVVDDIDVTNVICNGDATGVLTVNHSGGTAPHTYIWSNGDNTQTITGLTAGAYSVTVVDDQNCVDSMMTNISEPTAILATLTPTDVGCFGELTGSISTTVSGGNAPYSYLWSNGSTLSSISGVGAGNYSLTVTDASLCADTLTSLINQPANQLVLVTTVTDEMSNGANDGTANAMLSGGTMPYNYLWSNGETTAAITGLAPGDYSVTCTDANGCTRESMALTVEPYICSFALSAMNTVNVLCNGESTGSATPVLTGGTAPFTFDWSDGSSGTSLSNVPAGNYSVVITDGANCSITEPVVIGEPTALAATFTTTGLTTNGGMEGTATANPTGGTPPYNFVWSNGNPNQTATGLSAGFYNVTCTDDNGCEVILNDIEIPVFDCVLEIENINKTDVLCFGESTGEAIAVVINSVGVVTYSWSNGGSTSNIANLPAGSYTLSITDETLCTDITSVVVLQPTTLEANLTTNNQSGLGANDGSGTVNPTGGTAPYTVVWSTGDTGNSTTGLAPGDYDVSITDDNDCEVVEPFTIQDFNCDLEITSLIATDVECFGDANGTATPVVIGGNGVYSYSWSNGSTGPVLTNGTAGEHILNVTDGTNCFDADTVIIGGPSQLVINLNSTNVTAAGAMDGTASVAHSGGVPPYTIEWSTGESTTSISGLTPGSYSVIIRDANDCSENEFFNISDFNCDLVLNNILKTDVSCFGLADGTATPFVSGGDGNYSFSWDNGSSDSLLTNVQAGVYNLIVTDGANCSVNGMITILEPTPLVTNFSFTNETMSGGMDGTAMVDPTGGTAPYSVLWSTGEITNSISGLAPNTYSVEITDDNGCIETESFAVQAFGCTMIADSISTTDISCFGLDDGIATSFVSGEQQPVMYNWSGGFNTETITNLAPGMYFLTATDANGCIVLDTTTIFEPNELLVTLTGTNASVGIGNDGSITSMVTGGVMPYSFSWSNSETTPDITGLSAGRYTLIVTDANNCTATSSEDIIVDGSPCDLEISLLQIRSVRCFGESNGSITPVTLGGEGPMTFTWSNGTMDSVATNLPTGEFDVLITDQNGCIARDTGFVPQPDTMIVTITSTDQTVLGTNDGTASASATGGNVPYEWLWNNGAMTPNIMDLAPGVYSCVATDRNGCEASGSVRIRDADDPICVTFAGTMSPDTLKICAGDSAIGLQADPPFLDADDIVEYVLHDSPSDLLGNVLGRNDAPKFGFETGMVMGQPYYISAITGSDDGFGSVNLADTCLSVAIGQVVIFLQSPVGVYSLQGPNLACGNVPFYMAAGDLVGAGNNIQYRWTLPTGDVIFTDEPEVSIIPSSNLFTGDYYVSRDSLGCLSVASSPIFIEIVSLAPDVVNAGRDTVLCDGSELTITATSTLNEPGSWESTGFATVESPNQLTTKVTNLQPGANYFVWRVALDECPTATADTVRVIIETPPRLANDSYVLENATDVITLDVLSNDNLSGVVDTNLTILTQPQFGNIEFDPVKKQFKYWLNESERGLVEFTYQVCNPLAECGVECDVATITIYSFALPELPGGITPNGDGNNDVLEIKGLKGFDKVTVKVVNRWGNLVYSSDNYNNDDPWNGTYDNSGKRIPGGTYYYFVDSYDYSEKTDEKIGKTITGAIHIILQD